MIVAVIVLVVLATGAGCRTTGSSANEAESGHRSSVGAGSSPDEPLCHAEKVSCFSVSADGVTVDYAIIGAGATVSRGLVLVELGGPGFDALARASTAGFGLPDTLRDYDLLLIREPWAGQSSNEGCASQLDDFGRALSGGVAGQSALRCRYSSWNSERYASVLTSALRQRGRTLTGIIGQSFGALPAAVAAQVSPTAWLLIHAPIAPPGATGARVTSDRVATLRAALDRSYRSQCRPLGLDCGRTGSSVVDEAVQGAHTMTVAGRSTPLGRGDVALAVVAAAYDLHANEQWLWRTLRNLSSLTEQDRIGLGRLSDQLVQRFDRGRVSAKFGAHVAGLCASYRQWPERSVPPEDAVAFFPEALAAQCNGLSGASPAWRAVPVAIARRAGRSCLLTNDLDTVVAAPWSRDWARLLGLKKIEHYAYAGHVSLDRAMKKNAGCDLTRADQPPSRTGNEG